MRIVIQRVSHASVYIENNKNPRSRAEDNSGSPDKKGAIDRGLLLFAGIGPDDEKNDALWLASKICSMRIFEDSAGKMNLSVKDINGEILLISQFTLFASTKKGNRPLFNGSAKPEEAIPLYNYLHKQLEMKLEKSIPSGEFGAHMNISLCNDGPVTIIIDSKERN